MGEVLRSATDRIAELKVGSVPLAELVPDQPVLNVILTGFDILRPR